MLVDTGVNVTLLRTDIAQKLNQQFIYVAPNIFLKTATGEKANIYGKLDASIECGSRRFQHKVCVADITDPCILGLDFLREFNFMVDLERNEIRTRGEEIPLFSANIEFPKLCSVFAKEKTVIPARSECLIRGVAKASEHFRYAVTNSPSQISEKGVLVAATLVDLKKETIPIQILNMDNKPKTMDKGVIIASYEPVVDIVARLQEFSGEQPIQSILENLEGLNEDQRTELQKLLQEFRNLFSTCDADVGLCNMTQLKINTVGKTFEEHFSNIRKVFQRLQKANLKLSPKKCKFFRKEVSYLGHVIYSEGVKTDPEKIKAVVDWPRPETVHELRNFLGLCTYDRRFVRNFSTIARLLHTLTEAKSNFHWTEDCQKSFNSLKQVLTSSPVLTYPRTDEDFTLDTDASNEGIGAVLSQKIGNEECVIAYFSKSLDDLHPHNNDERSIDFSVTLPQIKPIEDPAAVCMSFSG
ncbi:retrovirus-related Pol polyprotein from transposon opus [Nephila pilipes]|uniref:RNA-directed DNA polymerase n=1 Tax=Nephila pilipes TaxID=299642 RepID=A0A8X6ULK2_NEPPI|nr:retrovirus-related Pol polyprotein from transposon opus [Nephila pilipes]